MVQHIVAVDGRDWQRCWKQAMKRAIAVGLVVGLSGCGDAPVDVSLDLAPGLEGFGPVKYVVISSRVDSVKLTKATVNRGNCKTFAWRGPNPLQFGQEKRAVLGCDLDQVKEVVVETDQGEFTFTF